jgi:Cof subfamily protein (haloacid dehalogenase superfamily)
MTSVKLIASDLDGTLLDSAGKMPERNFSAIREAMSRGVAVTVSTGRMFRSAMRFAEPLGIKIPLICYNGAMLRHPNGEILWHKHLELEMAKKLLKLFRELGVYVQSYVDDELLIRDPNKEEYLEYRRLFGVTGKVVGDGLYHPDAAPTKLLAITGTAGEAQDIASDLRERFGAELYVTRSNCNFVEAMNPEANKAKGLAKLAEIIGVNMEEVLAIGDGENDVEMVTCAGIGVAVSNGAKKIRDAADYVAPSNDENGVSWAVNRFVLNA